MKILILCTTDSMIWSFLIPHIYELSAQGCIVECAASETGNSFNELTNTGITIHKISCCRNPYSLRNAIAYKQLKKLVKTRHYDIIFCHEPVGGVLGRIVGKSLGCKVAYMAHGFHFFHGAPYSYKLYYYIEKYLSRYTDLLITINKEDYESSQMFHAHDVAFVNGIGIDISKFQSKESHYLNEKFCLPKNSLKLLSVGELIPRKNHISVIQAMKKFKGQDVHYFIAGDGKLECYLKKYVRRYHLDHQVHFLGFCQNINELCNSCDIFVFPSVQEGLSLALMEAMACGKPIVASKIRGNIDLIQHTAGGLLVDPFDVDGYYTSIKKIAQDPILLCKMGNINKKNIHKYDINIVKYDISKLIINLIH